MIAFFTRQYQAVPALVQLCREAGGTLVSTRRSTVNAVRKVYGEIDVARLNELCKPLSRGHHVLQKSRLIVTGSPYKKLLMPYHAKTCMVFHGTYAFLSNKEIDELKHFDMICMIGPRMQQAFQGAGLDEKLMRSGYLPFMEFSPKDDIARMNSLASMHLDPQNKTLLYLPRGRPYGSWDIMAERFIKEIPQSFNLILRPHPSQSVTARLYDNIKFMRLQYLARIRGNCFLDLTSQKLSSMYSIADLVMTDGASSPEEALFYDMPMLFIESQGSSPAAIAKMMREKDISEDYIEKLLTIYQCGHRLKTEDSDLLRAIETALADADQYKPFRQSYFQWVFGDRGLAGQNELIRALRQYN